MAPPEICAVAVAPVPVVSGALLMIVTVGAVMYPAPPLTTDILVTTPL